MTHKAKDTCPKCGNEHGIDPELQQFLDTIDEMEDELFDELEFDR
jgi:hypothetical protein